MIISKICKCGKVHDMMRVKSSNIKENREMDLVFFDCECRSTLSVKISDLEPLLCSYLNCAATILQADKWFIQAQLKSDNDIAVINSFRRMKLEAIENLRLFLEKNKNAFKEKA